MLQKLVLRKVGNCINVWDAGCERNFKYILSMSFLSFKNTCAEDLTLTLIYHKKLTYTPKDQIMTVQMNASPSKVCLDLLNTELSLLSHYNRQNYCSSRLQICCIFKSCYTEASIRSVSISLNRPVHTTILRTLIL